jgi:methylenetetrahydrofolate dehydrogenase (NADP+)/methenyltetrahydrofolate cyclohydrolase
VRREDTPGLAVVLAGHDPSSEIYVRNKIRSCQQLGIYSEKLTPSAQVTTEELLQVVEGLNRRPEIDSILVQLPLPRQVDTKKVLLAIEPEKDADGLHPLNLGKLLTNAAASVHACRAIELPAERDSDGGRAPWWGARRHRASRRRRRCMKTRR